MARMILRTRVPVSPLIVNPAIPKMAGSQLHSITTVSTFLSTVENIGVSGTNVLIAIQIRETMLCLAVLTAMSTIINQKWTAIMMRSKIINTIAMLVMSVIRQVMIRNR